MLDPTNSPNVFLMHVTPQSNIAADEVEKRLFESTKRFVLPSYPHVAPEMFSHRILREEPGRYVWEILLDGFDIAEVEDTTTTEPVERAVRFEAEQWLASLGVIQSFTAYTNLPIPAPHVDVPVVMPDDSGITSFGADDAPWYEHAKDSGTANASKELPTRIVEAINDVRSEVPAEPNLKPYGKGHVYFALEDKAHRAWLAEWLATKESAAGAADRRKIRAFAAFQTREGTTASINTYDNQIVTWGTGWGGLGWLGAVMTRTVANNDVRAALERAGVRYRSQNTYDIVDLQSKRVVTGKKEALEVMRASLPLLYLLIKLSRAPETREAIANAQLGTFFVSAGDISSANEMATQALFNMVSHLKHWAPGYATGCLEWAVPQVSGEKISAERDKRLASLVGRYFYGKARGKSWVPDWKQFQSYWRHMKEDGLDCLSDPFIQASAHPTDDPFAATPVKVATSTPSTTTTTPSTTTATPSTTTTPTTTTTTPQAKVLQSALLSREEQLELVATGRALLRRGARGSGISAIQQVLLNLGYSLPGGVNAHFEEGTEHAVQAFQRAHGLKDDGIIGAQTIKKLDIAASNGANG